MWCSWGWVSHCDLWSQVCHALALHRPGRRPQNLDSAVKKVEDPGAYCRHSPAGGKAVSMWKLDNCMEVLLESELCHCEGGGTDDIVRYSKLCCVMFVDFRLAH